jgi:hypothetical protein
MQQSPRDLPDGRAQVGDRHLKIDEGRDNLPAAGDAPASKLLERRGALLSSLQNSSLSECAGGR